MGNTPIICCFIRQIDVFLIVIDFVNSVLIHSK